MVTILNDASFDVFLKASSGLNVILFSTQWCGPCKQIKPLFNGLHNAYPNVKFGNVDIDECKSLAARYQVQSIPTTILFHGTQTVDTVKGANMPELHTKIAKESCKLDLPGIIPSGSKVKVKNVSKSELNGLNAEVLNYNGVNDRYVIAFADEAIGNVSVKQEKLSILGQVDVQVGGMVKIGEIIDVHSDGLTIKVDNGETKLYKLDDIILKNGHRVTIVGLKNAVQYNDLVGKIEGFKGSGDEARYTVGIEGRQLVLRRCNCLPIGM